MRLFWTAIFFWLSYVESYYVTLKHDGPVMTDANVTFIATLFDDDGTTPTGSFMFQWIDDAVPPHTAELYSDSNESKWSINYKTSGPGSYKVLVKVNLLDATAMWRIASKDTIINVTPLLNGAIKFYQNSRAMDNNFVSSNNPVEHSVELTKSDLRYITESFDSIKSMWFHNKLLIGFVDGLNFTYNYTRFSDREVRVEAYVIVTQPKKHTVPIITTTATGKERTTTVQPVAVTHAHTMTPLIVFPLDIIPDIVCSPPEPKTPYGCFKQDVSVKDEVNRVIVNGFRVVQGNMMNLTVSCNGSPPYWYCRKIMYGKYESSGNENCLVPKEIQDCSFKFLHYFTEPAEYTVMFIIGNDVSRMVIPVEITLHT